MLQVKCIEKLRNKISQIISYKIVDKNKNTVVVKPDKLKEAIRSKQLDVVNLTLTSDNRLIDKKSVTKSEPINKQSKTKNINVEAMLSKARAIGYIIATIDTDCGHKCYMVSSPDNSNHILIIPDDVQYIYDEDEESNVESAVKLFGDTKVENFSTENKVILNEMKS